MITEYTGLCLICGKPKEEVHHLVYGRGMRNLAEEDNLKVPLCRTCHKSIHSNEVAGKMSKILGQMEFEMQRVAKGIPQEIAREEFRKRYGRSYL